MKSILVVDDEVDLCEIFREIFSQSFNVYTAANGIFALDIILTEKIDFIFSDVDMPLMNGIELVKNIRQIDQSLPICLMTGGSGLSREEALVIGANHLVFKAEFDFDTLLELTKSYFPLDFYSHCKTLEKIT